MGWRSKRKDGPATPDRVENVLGRTSLFRGDFVADGAFQIEGWVEGSVESRAEVIICEGGAVRGNVCGTDVVVAGQVFGNIICSGHLAILATGKIEGNIDAKSVQIETGGVFRGASHMGEEVIAPAETEAPVDESDYQIELSSSTASA